jgi:aminopeptidase N
MEWWTDLWLKESFADYLGLTNLIENPELENYPNGDIWFIRMLGMALETDTLKTTHPIQVNVRHTEDAANVFDHICYRKGACFIK